MSAWVSTWSAGDVRVDAIVDGARWMRFDEMPRPPALRRSDASDRREFRGRSWHFVIRMFLVRSPHGTVLVDAGIGPEGRPLTAFMGSPGRLPAELAALGVEPGDVDHVVLTHAHDDHVGWAVNESGGPAFPAAVYHLADAEFRSARERGGPYWDSVYASIAARPSTRREVRERTLLPGIGLHPTGGHTPGHQSVRIESSGRTMLVLGDLVHFSHQLSDPRRSGPFDKWPEAAAAARIAALADLPPGAVLASAHLPDPFTTFRPDQGTGSEPALGPTAVPDRGPDDVAAESLRTT